MTAPRTLLVTVAGPAASADVAVAADVPLWELLPSLFAVVAPQFTPGARADAARTRLVRPDGADVPMRATLGGAGVLDGAVLRLLLPESEV